MGIHAVDEGAKERKRTADELMETAQELYERATKLSSEAERTDDVFADYLKAKDAYQEQRKEHRKLFNIMLRQRSTGAVTALVRFRFKLSCPAVTCLSCPAA